MTDDEHQRTPEHSPAPLPVDPDLPGAGSDTSTSSPRRRARRRHRPPGAQLVLVTSIGIGGVVGALSRYVLEQTFPPAPGQIPWVVLAINLTGSALLGLLLVVLVEQFPRGRLARSMLGTGIIGAYTTFSTFTVGAVEIGRAGHDVTAVVYVVLSVLGGLVAAAAGIALGRLAMRVERWLQEMG